MNSFKFKSDEQELDGLDVGSFFCIGRNYAAHAKEMGAEIPSKPLIFSKPPTAYLQFGENINLPKYSEEIHYETELAIIISEDCYLISTEEAEFKILAIAMALDLTARDLQKKAKEKGEPWEISKSFYASSPLSKIISYKKFKNEAYNFKDLDFTLELNKNIVQHGMIDNMIFDIPRLIVELSQIFYLRKGDVILTGTPEGVGKLNPGDKLEIKLNGKNQNILSWNLEVN